MSYNGWTNYETWNVALWIDNDYGAYQTKCAAGDAGELLTARQVREFVEGVFPNGTPDMQRGAMSYNDVNWGEIADNWADEFQTA